jgi:hypothetical protein
MHARFIAAVVTGLAGGFVVTVSQAFSPGITAWLAFGVGLALLVVAAFPVLFGERGIAGVALDAVGSVLAVWTVVASVVFSGEVVKWLSFAEGAGFVALAVAGLVLNQLRLARSIHRAAPVQVPTGGSSTSEPSRPAAVAA